MAALAAMALVGIGRLEAWLPPKGPARNFSLCAVRQQLPALSEALYDGAWAKETLLPQLELARRQYPVQAKLIDQYLAAWFFWHHDAARGEAALWRLAMQAELVRYYEGQLEVFDRLEHRVPQRGPSIRLRPVS